MPIYMKIQDIDGEVQDPRFKSWIRLESWGPSKTSMTGRTPAAGTDRTPGPGSAPEIIASMMSNSASVKMFQATSTGRSLGRTIIVVDNGQPEMLVGFALENTMITSYIIGPGGGGNLPMDSFTLVGAKLARLTEAELKEVLKSPSPARRRP